VSEGGLEHGNAASLHQTGVHVTDDSPAEWK
jgi:hypothetical protein